MPFTMAAPGMALALFLAMPIAPAPASELEMLPDGKARARIGELKLYHDPAEWRIEGEAGTFAVHCTGPECEAPLMTIVAVPRDLTTCSAGAVIDRSALDYPNAWTRKADRASAVRLTVHVATLDQGCRNWAGSPVYACTEHGDTTYWFIAAGRSCRTPVARSEALRHLLNGLSPAELTDP